MKASVVPIPSGFNNAAERCAACSLQHHAGCKGPSCPCPCKGPSFDDADFVGTVIGEECGSEKVGVSSESKTTPSEGGP